MHPTFGIEYIMDLKVVGKCFIKQESGLVIDEAGNKLLAKSVMFCKMTPFVIIEEGNINNFTCGKIETVYQIDDQFFEFYEGRVKELHVEISQSIITSVFHALMGSSCKTKRRQVTGIPSTLVMAGLTIPTTVVDAQTTAVPLNQVETALEMLMPAPVTEVPVQMLMVDSQLGGLYITNAQVHKGGSNVSI